MERRKSYPSPSPIAGHSTLNQPRHLPSPKAIAGATHKPKTIHYELLYTNNHII